MLNDGEKPDFKLSQPVIVDYGDVSMKEKAGKVLSHIIWLLSQTQNETSIQTKSQELIKSD